MTSLHEPGPGIADKRGSGKNLVLGGEVDIVRLKSDSSASKDGLVLNAARQVRYGNYQEEALRDVRIG